MSCYSATQSALLSSLTALARTVAGSPTGVMATSLGWPLFFAVSILGAIPGLALLWRLKRRGAITQKEPPKDFPADVDYRLTAQAFFYGMPVYGHAMA